MFSTTAGEGWQPVGDERGGCTRACRERRVGMGRQSEVTQLLSELSQGGSAAVDRLIPIVYEELRQIAHRQMRGERPDHTLDTTALVHEAYVKLVGLDRLTWQNRAHFL